jgi:hypothetical protein
MNIKIFKIVFSLICISLFSCSGIKETLKIYTNEKGSLYYEEINTANGKTIKKKEIIDIDVFDYNQKENYVILNRYDNEQSSTLILKNGDIIDKINYPITDFQISSCSSKDLIVIDSSDVGFNESNLNYSICLYNTTSKKAEFVKIYEKDVFNFDAFNKYSFKCLFFPKMEINKLNENYWDYKLYAFDLRNRKQSLIMTIQQSNNNFKDGQWEFLTENSFWKSENKLTYLMYFIDEINVQVRIYEYDFLQEKNIIYRDFILPKSNSDINLKYILDNKDNVFITDSKCIYKIDEMNNSKSIFKSERTILGFNIK